MGASFFQPYVFDLSSGSVIQIQTGPVDPRVVLNRQGLVGTDAQGNKILNLDAIAGTGSFKGGVSISADTTAVPTPSAGLATKTVRWTRDSDGKAIANVMGTSETGPPNEEALFLSAFATPGTDIALAKLWATAGDNLDQAQAQLTVAKTHDLASEAFTNAQAQVVNRAGLVRTKTILDALGQSDFVQIGQGASRLYIVPFQATLTWPGGTNQVTGPNFVHGIAGATNAYYLSGVGMDNAGVFVQLAHSVNNCIPTIWDPFGNPPAGAVNTVWIVALVTT